MAKEVSQYRLVAQVTGVLKRELTLLPLFGLIYFTVCGLFYTIFSTNAFASLVVIALIAMASGAVLYFQVKKNVKQGVPDVDPFDVPITMSIDDLQPCTFFQEINVYHI